MAAPGQLNLDESPSWGSRSVDCFEKLEQIGEGTYGYSMPSIHALLLMGFFFYFLCMFNFLHYYCIPRLMIYGIAVWYIWLEKSEQERLLL